MSLADQIPSAADTLQAVSARVGLAADAAWRPSELRAEAEHIESEDREKAWLERQVEEMARDLQPMRLPSNRACELIEKGWRKGEPDD
jgi:hypothetical protein